MGLRGRRVLAIVGLAGSLALVPLNVESTSPPADPPPSEPATTTEPATPTEPATTAEPATSTTTENAASTTEIPLSSTPGSEPTTSAGTPTTTGPPASEVLDASGTMASEPVESGPPPSTEPPGTEIPSPPSLLMDFRLFPDGNGNLVDDEGDVAVHDGASVVALAELTNTSPDAADLALTLPGTGSVGFAGLDVVGVRVAGALASARADYSDRTSRDHQMSASLTDVTRADLRVEALHLTFVDVPLGGRVRVEIVGVLNDTATPPAIEVCAAATASNDGGVTALDDCDAVEVAEPPPALDDAGGISILSLVAQPTWELTPGTPTSTGTMAIPSNGFPPATFTTDSDGPAVVEGTDVFLNTATPFGAAFESTEGRQFLTTSTAGGTDPSTTTFQFGAATPPGWGFALGDVDLDVVTITATGPGGVALSPEQLGFQSVFNYCVSDLLLAAPLPPGCADVGTDLPVWDPVTGTLTGNGPNSDGASAWFRPTVPIVSLTITQGTLSTAPLMQLWFAARTSDISGTVTSQTSGGFPLIGAPAGTVLQLLNADGSPAVDGGGNPITTTPDADGNYLFDEVPAAPYLVAILQPIGWTVVGSSELTADASNADVAGVDFLVRQLPPLPTTPPIIIIPPTTVPPPPTLPPPTTDSPTTTVSPTTTEPPNGGGIIIEPTTPLVCPPPAPDVEPPPNPDDTPLPPPPPPEPRPPGCPPIVRALPPPTPNPPLPAACGITVNLVVDRSYSIQTAGATGAVKSALTAFVDTLNNTGSTVAVVDFAEQAYTAVPFTPLNDGTRGQFDDYIRNYNPNGNNTKGTNWDDALYQANLIGGPADADLTLFLTDGQPNRSGTGHHPSSSNSERVLEYAAIHANEIKASGTRMFVVGVGDVAGHTRELSAVSGPINGTDIATADYSTVPDFDDLADSLEDLVYGLCSSSMTVSKYVDGVLTPGWDISSTVTSVTPAGTRFQWRNPAQIAAVPATRTKPTGAEGTATFEWVLGSEASPVPGSVTMTINETMQPGYVFIRGTCSIDSAAGSDREVTFSSLPADVGSIPFDAIVRCALFNHKIPVVVPIAPTVGEAECVAGELTPPTLTLPDDSAGVTYTAEPAGPYDPGETVVVTATLAAGYSWPSVMPPRWTQTSDTTATYTVTFGDVSCADAVPLDPQVAQATCTGGEVTAPTIIPNDAPGVTYTIDPPGPYDGTVETSVTVTASLADGYAWADPLPTGWTAVDPTTATFTVELVAASCADVVPVAPAINDAVCTGGKVTEPELTLPETDGVSYTSDPAEPYAPGETVVVTATLISTGFAWPDELPDGWTETSPTTATYTVTFADVSCTPTAPREPDVLQAACVDGELVAASVTPRPTVGITYVVTPPGPYAPSQDHTVVVTATLDDGFEWTDPLPDGWTRVDDSTATYTVELETASCRTVSPALPSVTDAECVDGVLSEPTVVVRPSPWVAYSTDPLPPYESGQTVVVTATLDPAGVAWSDPLPDGWIETSPTTATYTVTFAEVACTPATPLDPVVVQATCSAGSVTTPTITAEPTDGVTYSFSPPAPYDGTIDTTVTVTATLADGFAWVDPLPAGWTLVDATTATFTVELAAASCTEVTPGVPVIDQAECVDGSVSEPTLTVPVTDGIVYTTDVAPPYTAGETVVVTATLDAAGVAWPPTMPDGWIETSPTTATYTVTFAEVTCTPVSPLDPDVAPATCANGVVTEPTVTPSPLSGITYSVEPAGPYDGTLDTTVTVTATLADGFAWTDPLPVGWTYVDDVTATFTVELEAATCDEISPVAPDVVEAECVDGAVTEPTLTTPDTPGITYTTSAEPPYAPGQTVVVTATLDSSGVAWPPTMPDGWTRTSATSATYTVTFAPTSCTPATPLDPATVQATCVAGEVTEPTITSQPTDGVTYTLDPAGPYDGTVDTTVVETATLADGYEWNRPLPGDWVYVDALTATLTVLLVGTTCDEVTPVSPAVDDAECVDGVISEPTLTLPETDGIVYSTDVAPPYAPGDSVVVTATLDPDGVGWPATMPPGWTLTSTTTATYTVTFADVSCTSATPLAPVVNAAVCASGAVTEPTVDVTPTDGVSYTVDPAGPYDGAVDTAVTVTATLADGFGWVDPLPVGWTRVDAATATFDVELAAASCSEVTPVLPSNHPAECIDGELTAPTLTFDDTDGITYTVNADPPYAAGQTVIVTATLDGAGVSWPAEMPEEWVVTSPTTASYVHTFADVSCTAVLPVLPQVTMATCSADGSVIPSSVTPATTPGVTYSVTPAGPYDPARDIEVVVTATLEEGFAWGEGTSGGVGWRAPAARPERLIAALPSGWVQTGPTTATYTLVLPALPECPQVSPDGGGVQSPPDGELPSSR